MTQTTQSKRLPKFKRAPKQAPPIRLTDRDRELMLSVYHYRFLPTSLIVRRHFGSLTRGRARLRGLYHHKYVDRHYLPTQGPTTSEAIYSLGPAAVPELAAFYGFDPADVKRRRRRVEPMFLAHQLAIARFRIGVAYAGAPNGIGFADWLDETEGRMRFQGEDERGGLRTLTLAPDGMSWLRSKRARFAFALEVDRGSMPLGRIEHKFRRYQQADAAGALRPLLGAERFRILVLAPSERRAQGIVTAAERAQAANVWVATDAALEADPALEPLWQRPGSGERLPLFRQSQVFDPKDKPTTQGGS